MCVYVCVYVCVYIFVHIYLKYIYKEGSCYTRWETILYLLGIALMICKTYTV